MYCTIQEIRTLIGENVSDTLDNNDQLIEDSIKRAIGRIHTRLRKRGVPLPDPVNYSSSINAVCTYYAVCDIYATMYNGDDYQTQASHWCNMGTELLDDYIDAYWEECAEEDEQIAHNVVRHSNARTYYAKRGRSL